MAWNFSTVFYTCANWVQNHICTKGSSLVTASHSFCVGQNRDVMHKAKELRMNFFLVTSFLLSTSLRCVRRTSVSGILRVVTALAYLCFDTTSVEPLWFASSSGLAFSHQSLHYQNVRFLDLFFPLEPFFPLLQQIQPFLVCGLPG